MSQWPPLTYGNQHQQYMPANLLYGTKKLPNGRETTREAGDGAPPPPPVNNQRKPNIFGSGLDSGGE